MEFKILAVGHFSSNNPYRTLFESYQKRMKEKVKLIEIKNLNYDIQKKLSEEKKLILNYFELNSEVIILDKEGKNISSIEMADFFKKKSFSRIKKNYIYYRRLPWIASKFKKTKYYSLFWQTNLATHDV